MPPLDGGGHLIGYLWEIGPTMPGAAGSVPLSHSEIRAFQDNIGFELQPWEIRTIRSLSCDYVSELHRGEDPDAKPPYGELVRAPDLDEKLSAFLY